MKQLGICHGSNRITTIVGAVPAEALEVINWLLNFKVQHAVFTKHSEGRTLLTPCSSRYGYNFIVMFKAAARGDDLAEGGQESSLH